MAGVGTGVASGAMKGAKLGSFLGPKGMAAGAVIGGAVGGLSANKRKNEAESSQNISLQDPNEVSRLQRLDQIVKNLERGTDTLTQNKISEVQKMGAQTQGAISKVSGGDVGATTQGLLQAQRNVQTGTNQALADRGQLGMFSGLAANLAQRVSQRSLELQLLNRNQQTAEYAQGAKENNVSGLGAIATNFGGMIGKDGLNEYGIKKGVEGLGFKTSDSLSMATPNSAGSLPTAPTLNTLGTGSIDLTSLGG